MNLYICSNKSYSQGKEQCGNWEISALKDLSKLSVFQGRSLHQWLAESWTLGSVWTVRSRFVDVYQPALKGEGRTHLGKKQVHLCKKTSQRKKICLSLGMKTKPGALIT